jgi:Domain of unknown function (DUF2828)
MDKLHTMKGHVMSTFAAAVQAASVPQQQVPAFTTNGMVTLPTSGSSLVNLFFAIGSSRGKDISGMFDAALAEDALLALKILFWARDVRGGAGERDTFRKLMVHLEATRPEVAERLIPLIPVYGRWDDGFVFQSAVRGMALRRYAEELKSHSAASNLAAKWAPRKGRDANDLRKALRLDPKSYRQLLVSKTKVVEQQMCARDWTSICYEHVPSVASARYTKAFNRHDPVGYVAFKDRVKSGGSKINAQTLYPHDVLKTMAHGDVDTALLQWQALPNYLGDDFILPMVDVSGSMTCAVGGQRGVATTCLDVACGLGLYLADKQQGAFRDMFLTFSGHSHIQLLTGDLSSKLRQMQTSDWGMNTNLENAYKEILQVAVTQSVPQSEMPRYLLILSDMEFDLAVNGANVGAFDMARDRFAQAGYELPKIVFWNLNARQGNVPVQQHQSGAALVSGFSPSIMESILKCETFTPWTIMMQAIGNSRYDAVAGAISI